MSERNCAGCKFRHLHNPDDSHGECCAITTNNVPGGRVVEKRDVYVSGVHAMMNTRARFSCSMWVEREPGQYSGEMP